MMLTLDRLRAVLTYDPETGLFQWRGNDRAKSKNGLVAGTINPEGYRRIQIDRRLYQASVLAWFYMTGVLPTEQVDHRNRIPSDDRWNNLRLASQSQNKANSGAYRNNKLGVKGVRQHRNGQFEARLRVAGRLRYLGCYRSIEEAKAAYDAAATAHFGEFARSA